MNIPTAILAGSAVLLPQSALAQSPWLPAPGQTALSLSYIHQSADELFAGPMEAPLPDDLELDSYLVGFDHGISDSLAVFGSTGYATSDFPPAGDNDQGIGDTRIGLAWRLLDEFETAPLTLTARGAVIIAGDYEVGRIDAIGDGESGYELMLGLGRQLLPRLKAWGTLGYRDRASPVPSETFYDLNLGVELTRALSATLGYALQRSNGDLDIGGPGFTPAGFPEVQEERDVLRLGLSYALDPQLGLGINYASVEDGRNTPISDVYGVSLGFSF